MPDKIVTLNYILVGVFCKSGENVWFFFCTEKQKHNCNSIKQNFKKNVKNNNNLKQYYTCFYMLKPFFVFDPPPFVIVNIFISNCNLKAHCNRLATFIL